jgi:hypothetical protein
MKKQITTLMVALLTILTVSGQVKDLHFTYDEAGNRIARGLTLSGVPVLGTHPYLLRFQIANGLRPYMFNYTYTNGY